MNKMRSSTAEKALSSILVYSTSKNNITRGRQLVSMRSVRVCVLSCLVNASLRVLCSTELVVGNQVP